MVHLWLFVIVLLSIGLTGPGWCATPFSPRQINLPVGFHISLYADNVPNARSMASGPDGVLFKPVDLEILPDGSMLVSDDDAGRIYRIVYRP